ncbi:Kinesin light chain [Minicystis rosea]|nr:Kinesin light chain [Minicystis rosea]
MIVDTQAIEARWEQAAHLLGSAEEELAAGRLSEAETQAARAAADLAATAGAEHPDHGHAILVEGAILAARGQIQEAAQRYDEALAIFDLHPEEPVVRAMARRARGDRADLLIKMGQLGEAETALRTLLLDVEAESPIDAREEAFVLNMLGVCLRFSGAYEDAEIAYRRALEVRERAGLSPSATLLHNLAGLAAARGDFAAAERDARAALAQRRAAQENVFAVAMELCGLGDALAGQARFLEAEVAYREAIALYTGSEQLDHPEVAYALHNLADTLVELGRTGEAEKAYADSLARKVRILGDEHHEVAVTLNNLAALLFEVGRPEEALARSERACAIVRAALASDHPVRAGCESLAASLRAG